MSQNGNMNGSSFNGSQSSNIGPSGTSTALVPSESSTNMVRGGRPSTTPKKLAPLDHIKNLYDGAAANLKGENRKIFQKKDLIDAVREMNANTNLNKMLNCSSDTALMLMVKDGGDKLLNEKDKERSDTDKKKNNNKKDGASNNNNNNEKASPTRTEKKKALPKIDLNKRKVQLKSASEILQETLNFNAKKYNEYKVAVEKKEDQLNRMIDELASLQVENESLRKMELHQTNDTHKIDELNEQITQATTTLEDKQHRKMTLLHMKKRLDMNQVAFDAHIKGMEEALNASSREFEEVKLLMRQLETGNSNAQDVLKTTLEKLAKERDLRNKHLAQRRQEAANAKRMEEWREKREKARMVLDAELRGDLTAEDEQKLIQAVQQSAAKDEELEKIHQRTTQAVSTYEEAFAAIREATGVRTLDEMVEKFLGQSANKAALLEEKAEAEQRQRKVKEDLARVQTEFAEFKAAGLGGSELNREMYDKLDNAILEARHELKIKQAVNERLENILIQIRAGMLGLLSRLAPFKQILQFDDEPNSQKSGVEVLDLTLSCEARLMKLLDSTAVKEVRDSRVEDDASVSGAMVVASKSDGPNTSDLLPSTSESRRRPSINVLEEASQMTHINNIRVRPRRVIGNGELGTPLSTARSAFEDDPERLTDGTTGDADGDQSNTSSGEQLLLMDSRSTHHHHHHHHKSSSHHYDDDEDDDEEDDESGVYDAATLKKQSEAAIARAMEEKRTTMRRERTISNLKGKKTGKQRVKELAQPAKHRQVRGKSTVFDRPNLV